MRNSFCVCVTFSRQEAINVNLQGTNVIKAKQLMDATIAQLNEHKKKVTCRYVQYSSLSHILVWLQQRLNVFYN